MAAQGLTDKEIAASLGITRETVSTHWKRIRQAFDASSRTAIVAQAIGSNLGNTTRFAGGDRLLFEMAERDRIQAELKATVRKLNEEVERRTTMLAKVRQEHEQNRAQMMRRLTYLEELNRIITKAGIVPNLSEHTGSWRKLWVSESISAWGYSPEQVLNGEITPMNTLVPEDMVHSMQRIEKVSEGHTHIALSHRVICADGSIRVVLDLVRAEPVGPDGIGNCSMIAIDITEFVDELRELIASGWPDLPLR